jgi:prepilin-type N-terminal cleavage/methylation domain-containing protein/prepilin-type processing-associated H-X9-DG protein
MPLRQQSHQRVGSASGGRYSNHGFSLIELLVVVAIIAILAGILIPTISLVRSSAKSTVCLNRFRQLGLTFEIYLNDNEGVYPPPNVGAAFNRWPNYILGIDINVGNAPTDGTADMFMCSEDPHRPTDIVPVGTWGAGSQVWAKDGLSHGYNTWGLGGKLNWLNKHDYNKTATRNQIRRADATILAVDTMQNWDHNGSGYLPRGYGYAQSSQFGVYPRHRGNTICNVLWVDGRASGVAAAGPDDFNSLSDPLRLGTWPQSTTDNCWDRE